MSMAGCPYCKLKKSAERKAIFTARSPVNGICPDCGAHIDIGQHLVSVNGYADIYKGVLRLMGEMVNEFNRILEVCNADLSDYPHTRAGKIELTVNTSEILCQLFVPSAGGTTKSNLAKALDIGEYSHTWVLSNGGGKTDTEVSVPQITYN